MRILGTTLVFAAVFVVDTMLLPGLFGFREGVLVAAFMLAMILNWGPIAPVLWLGSAMALFLEFIWNIQPGRLVIMFLIAALVFHTLSLFLRIKRTTGAVILSIGLWLFLGYNNFAIAITALAGFFLAFLLFDKVCSEKSTKYL